LVSDFYGIDSELLGQKNVCENIDADYPDPERKLSKMVSMKFFLLFTKYFRFWPQSLQHPALLRDLSVLFTV
jgi:hypothetical protein